MEKTLHNGTILKIKTSDYIRAGAAFQRYCTAQGIDKDVSLAMFIIGDRIRPHYYPTDADAILHAAPGFSQLPKIIEL